MLLSALRRSTNTRALRVVTHVNRGRLAPSTAKMQQRTFLTSPRVTSYVMARAKVLHLAARSFLAYNQIITLDSASSPLSRYFTRSATLRERVHMYLVCLLPPDQPIDLPDFLDGAKQAAHVVFTQLYRDEWAHNLAKEAALADVANDACVEKWTEKLETQRQALQLPVGTTFTLEKLEVSDVRLAEAEYEYSDAAMHQKNDTCSMYHMNEAVCLKVRYNVVEHLLTSRNDREDHPTRYKLRSTFDWSFYSDVSRARLVDWRITEATPFELEMVTDKREMKTKTPAPI